MKKVPILCTENKEKVPFFVARMKYKPYFYSQNEQVMLYRKFASHIEDFLRQEPKKILLVNGARQIGKSYLIRYVGKKMFKNYVEINLKEDSGCAGITCPWLFVALL